MARSIRVLQGCFGRVSLHEADRPVVEHAHPEPHVLVHVGGVDSYYVVSGERAPFTRQRLVLVNPLQPHSNPRPSRGAKQRVLAMYLDRDWLCDISPEIFGSARGRLFSAASAAMSMRLRRVGDELGLEMLHGELLGAERLEFLLLEFVLALLDARLVRPSLSRWEGSRLSDHRIRRAITLLRERAGKQVRLEVIAREAGLSRSRFYDLFERCTGLSPGDYLDMLCLSEAIRGLTGSNRPIVELSEDLGFSAQGHFTRFFVQHAGVTPSEYRRVASRFDESSSPSR